MSNIEDVQDAMVAVIAPAMYPNTTASPSIADGYISAIEVDEGGEDYTEATITLTGDGTGATAIANIVEGVIDSITVLNPGIGYSTASVTITGDGTDAEASATVSDIEIIVAAGDFSKADLDEGLALRKIYIAVFGVSAMTRNTTRLRRDWQTVSIDEATLTATVDEDTITIGGTITAGQAVMIIINNIGYSYAATADDTVDTIATALADAIPTASAIGAVITVPDVFNIIARISVQGTAVRILESQEGVFRVKIIAPDYPSRTVVGRKIPLIFGALEDYAYPGGTDYYLQMPDYVAASVKPQRAAENNMYEMDNAFCRDLLYLVEYHTVDIQTFQTIADASVTVTAQVTEIE